jgi:hypothetical protein
MELMKGLVFKEFAGIVQLGTPVAITRAGIDGDSKVLVTQIERRKPYVLEYVE